MCDPPILTLLRTERADIERHIEAFDARPPDARSDLLHVVAVMRMYDPSTVSDGVTKTYSERRQFYAPPVRPVRAAATPHRVGILLDVLRSS